jgi:carboxymethylenebutenolidase
MPGTDIRIRSREGPGFDCYLVMPEGHGTIPAIVLASTIRGVDGDLRGIADTFASHGYIAAAPDLFWRSVPGALARGDPRSVERGTPRLEKIRTGERDLADVHSALRMQGRFNGRAALIGFCYSGPYAILGPKRLGYDAGIACHGTQMLEFVDALEGVERPVRLLWGDQDTMAPAAVLDAYRAISQRMKNVEVHVFPGVRHGYMMRGSTQAYDDHAYDFSMACALGMLERLR